MTCSTDTCGIGGWGGPKPGDPDNNITLTAQGVFGGAQVAWTMPATYPEAVAHTKVYRGTSAVFSTAIEIATVGGNRYFDQLSVQQNTEYYYWISVISVNGTVGALIGPAQATVSPKRTELISELTEHIDNGVLAQSLKTEIAKITLNYTELTNEIAARVANNAALSAALASVQSGLTESLGLINQEVIIRQNGQNALATQYNTIAALNSQNAAAILTEQTARVTATTALATSITNLQATTSSLSTAVTNETTARINGDNALASAITTVQSSAASNLASVQTSLQTNINTVDGKVTNIGALWTAKVTVNGLVGGFGIYNNGSEVQAGFDVDTFWVGRTNSDKVKPFIVSGGTTFIDSAVIGNASISTLKIANEAVFVSRWATGWGGYTLTTTPVAVATLYLPITGLQSWETAPIILSAYVNHSPTDGTGASVYCDIAVNGTVVTPSFGASVLSNAVFSGNSMQVNVGNGTHVIQLLVRVDAPGASSKFVNENAILIAMSGKK